MAADRIIRQSALAAVAEPPPVARPESIEYPDSDGRFLPENPLQARAVVNLPLALQDHFRKVPNVVIEGNMFVYYREGDPTASCAPDIFVVLDHDLGGRSTYKLWEEGCPPDFALEVISPSSQIRNQEDKRDLYAELGIGEHFLFQPDPGRAEPRLLGYRLRGRRYRELAGAASGWLYSAVLGAEFGVEGANLRVRDAGSGHKYPFGHEYQERLETVETEATAAVKTARAEAEMAGARAKAAEAKSKAAEARVEVVEARVEVAEARAEAEAQARRVAEARLAELQAQRR